MTANECVFDKAQIKRFLKGILPFTVVCRNIYTHICIKLTFNPLSFLIKPANQNAVPTRLSNNSVPHFN